MKLKFKNQEFQIDAVQSVVGIFKGAEKGSMTFSIDNNDTQLKLVQSEFGVCNQLILDNDTLISNMHTVQKINKLPIARDFDKRHYSIEMETGQVKLTFTQKPYWN